MCIVFTKWVLSQVSAKILGLAEEVKDDPNLIDVPVPPPPPPPPQITRDSFSHMLFSFFKAADFVHD